MILETLILQTIFNDSLFLKIFLGSALGGLLGVLVGVTVILLFLIGLALYIYLSFTWMTIAKKLGYKKYWLAWIPVANLFLLPILARWNWKWGWFFFLFPVYLVLAIFWTWTIYERRNYPPQLSLLMILWLIPMFGLGLLINLIIFGFVAFKDLQKKEKKRKKND